jgi:hypothetical protein
VAPANRAALRLCVAADLRTTLLFLLRRRGLLDEALLWRKWLQLPRGALTVDLMGVITEDHS